MSEAPARGEGIGLDASRTGRRRCSTTASAATRTRWPRPQQASAHPEELGATRPGRWPSSSRPPPAAGGPSSARDALERLAESTQRQRHRLGARHRGALARAAERGRGRRAPLPRGDRAARPHPRPRGARPRPPALRRMAAPRATGAWTRASSCAPPTSMFTAMGAEAFAERAARELLATGETARKRTVETQRPAHRPGGADRPARPRRPLQPRDRRPAVHQPAHRRVPPAQGLRQARHQLAHASSRPRSSRGSRLAS